MKRIHIALIVTALGSLGILCTALLYLGFVRTNPLAAIINTPDGEHVVGLAKGRVIGQQFTYSRGTIVAVVFLFAREQLHDDVTLAFQLREQGQDQAVHQVTTTVSEARQLYESAPFTLRQSLDAHLLPPSIVPLLFRFPLVTNARDKTFEALIEAPTPIGRLPQLAFQIDSTKFPDGALLINGIPRPGDAGFVVYEQPSRFTLVGRWLVAPAQRGIWPGIAATLTGAIFLWLLFSRRVSLPAPVSFWRSAWAAITWQRVALASAVIVVATLVIYWPATRLTLFQDDLVKLMRVREFGGDIIKIFFTNHRYLPIGNEPQIPVGFYRPVSFSIFPWLLWHTVGLQPFFYHLSSLLTLAGVGVGLYIFSLLLMRDKWAALAAALIWIAHSSKIGAALWWSSTEDLLGSFWLIITLIIYTRLRAFPSNQVLLALTAAFTLAVFSKEHALLFFIILIPLELLLTRPLSLQWRTIMRLVVVLAPLVLVTGIFLMTRVVAIHDPTLPLTTQTDKSYALSLSPAVIAHNTIVYSAWTAENWLWSRSTWLHSLKNPLEGWLQRKLAPVRAELPYFPGISLIVAYFVALLAVWRWPEPRKFLLFAGVWWFIMLLPPLLFTQAWGSRWLTLSSWSLALAIVVVVVLVTTHVPRLKSAVLITISVVVIYYGFWMARLPERSYLYTELDRTARIALEQFTAQAQRLTSDSTIYFHNIPQELQGTVNVYLLRLFSDLPFKTTVQTSREPTGLGPHDVIIDIGSPPL